MAPFVLMFSTISLFLLLALPAALGDEQLSTLTECQKLFLSENKEMITELKEVVSKAVRVLPENKKRRFLNAEVSKDKIKNAGEFLKMVKFYNVAKNNVRKVISSRGMHTYFWPFQMAHTGRVHDDVILKWQEELLEEKRHFAKYKKFMDALGPPKGVLSQLTTLLHANAEAKLILIMKARKICDDLNNHIGNARPNDTELANSCNKLEREIGPFLEAVGFQFEKNVNACKYDPLICHMPSEATIIVKHGQDTSIGEDGTTDLQQDVKEVNQQQSSSSVAGSDDRPNPETAGKQSDEQKTNSPSKSPEPSKAEVSTNGEIGKLASPPHYKTKQEIQRITAQRAMFTLKSTRKQEMV